MYELPQFDRHFDPMVHNKYLSRWHLKKSGYTPQFQILLTFRKAKLLERQAIKKSCSSQCLESLIQPDAKMNKSQQKFTYTKCILESVIVGEYLKQFQFLLYAPTLEHYYVVIQLADISNHQVKVWSLCLV